MMRNTALPSRAARLADGALRRVQHLVPRAPRFAILMYHRIAEESFDPWQLAVSPAYFAEHMQWVRRARLPLPLAEFARRHRDGSLPPNAIAVTFDDGYACNATTAAPVLERLGIPATIFLPAELIGSTRLFWWDELRTIVFAHAGSTLRLDGEDIGLGPRSPNDDHWPRQLDQRTLRQQAFYSLWSRLQTKPPVELQRLMDELRAQVPVDTPQSHRLMTPDEVRSIRSDLVEFGSHALSHPSLPNLPLAEKKREIRRSVAACEAISGARPRTFAYPFGEFDADCEREVEAAGFACACTTERQPVRNSDRLFALPRIQVENLNVRGLKSAVAGDD